MRHIDFLTGLELKLTDPQDVLRALVEQLDDLRVQFVDGLAVFGDVHRLCENQDERQRRQRARSSSSESVCSMWWFIQQSSHLERTRSFSDMTWFLAANAGQARANSRVNGDALIHRRTVSENFHGSKRTN